MRQLILSPVIIALAFTLPYWWMTVAQVVSGIAYGWLGVMFLRMKP